MKKTSILASVFIIAVFTFLFSISSYAFTYGDVNNDGTVSTEDARLTLRAAVELEKFEGDTFKAADIDMNGTVSCSDARKILRKATGLEQKWPEPPAEEEPTTEEAEATTEGTPEETTEEETTTESEPQQEENIPVINITGDISGISKENKVKTQFEYSDGQTNISCYATLKIQGASSAYYPKKNFSLQLFKDDTFDKKNKAELFEGCGKQSKYCLKANWIDHSQARNVVSGKIYSQIVHSRDIDDEISALPNGGVVDGYPVKINLNGEFLGLYTLNIPKDKWMFGMDGDESSREAILMADDWTPSVALREPVAPDFSNGWDLEYCSTEDSETGTQWVSESFNELIAFINNNDGKDFKDGIDKYLSVERAIDCMIYTIFICGEDNTSKNMLWATYDGTKWIPSVYDMDGTWGLKWNGATFYDPTFLPLGSQYNLLWQRLIKNYPSQVYKRYCELRKDILSIENIEKQFGDFFALIPPEVQLAEETKWSAVPNIKKNNYSQIIDFAKKRADFLDAELLNQILNG